MSKGFIVEHKESGVRFAISSANYNPALHDKVRDLLPSETIIGFKPKKRQPVIAEPQPKLNQAPKSKPKQAKLEGKSTWQSNIGTQPQK